MATTKSLKSLEKSKEAVVEIKEKLLPVLQKLTDDKYGEATGRAQATVALSIGMMTHRGRAPNRSQVCAAATSY